MLRSACAPNYRTSYVCAEADARGDQPDGQEEKAERHRPAEGRQRTITKHTSQRDACEV